MSRDEISRRKMIFKIFSSNKIYFLDVYLFYIHIFLLLLSILYMGMIFLCTDTYMGHITLLTILIIFFMLWQIYR